ncbi:hypothetical protein P9B03_11925 [Metasolibacillus meyeri]|uniref:Phage tail-like C-terminal domain-containing protein n=1 Tax=Metasolibacillus meyeri TaxID=1071052 RepID=A0AAW9NKA9_9BACL|nr:hypothetical protein [Metasolibacillus meyeri]MEC1179194.1 hypothetical protein [Metasolibacillus meyeri]
MQWNTLLNLQGTYISKAYNLSSNLSNYITIIQSNSINVHSQLVDYYFSVSSDNIVWSDWTEMDLHNKHLLLNYDLSKLYFKYKVVMHSKNMDVKPYLQSFSISFEPCEILENVGDLSIKPKIWIRKKNGNGAISLVNVNNNQTSTINNLINNEEVYINCNKEAIVSDRQHLGVYRYDDHNGEFLELPLGINILKGNGDFDMDVRYQNIFIQE